MSVTSVGKYDFTIRKGDTLNIPIVFGGTGFEPTDITGWDAELVAIDCKTGDVLLTMTTGNSKIVVDGPALKISLVLSSAETEALTFTSAVYTLKLIDTPGTGSEVTYLTGTICIIDTC